MALSVNVYDVFFEQVLKGNIDWVSDVFYASLHDAETFTATDTVWANVSGTQISSSTYSDYTAGGILLANITVSTASNITKVDCDDIDWGAVTITAEDMVIRQTFPNDILCFHVDFDATESSSGTSFKYTVAANGIVRIGDSL